MRATTNGFIGGVLAMLALWSVAESSAFLAMVAGAGAVAWYVAGCLDEKKGGPS